MPRHPRPPGERVGKTQDSRATRRSDSQLLPRGLHVQTSRTKTYRISPVRTEPILQIQNRGHYSLMEGDKSSFSMSGYVPYRLTDTAMASAASVFWIRRDLPRMCLKQVSEYSACEDCTHRQNSCSKAFSTLYTLAPHNFMAFHGGGGGFNSVGSTLVLSPSINTQVKHNLTFFFGIV